MMNSRFQTKDQGFTLVELMVIVVIIAILATVTVVGYGAWRHNVADGAVKTDIVTVSTAMNNAKNFSNGYPTSIPANFTSSPDVTVTYVSGDATSYCIDATSKQYSDISYYMDSTQGGQPIIGSCEAGPGPIDPSQTIFVFDTTLPGCSANTIQLPVSTPSVASGSTISWGDSTTSSLTSASQSHTYGQPGAYTVKYNGPITAIDTGAAGMTSGSKPCLQKIVQWGSGAVPTRVRLQQSTNLVSVAEPPHTVTDMSTMFYGDTSFNQSIGGWDVSRITNMTYMFASATSFNQPLASWNVSNVTNMSTMFYGASAFNQPIGSWNTSKVTDMSYMFANAYSFNQDLSSWNVNAVTTSPPSAFRAGASSWTLAKPKPTW